jgi:hypothetical protein
MPPDHTLQICGFNLSRPLILDYANCIKIIEFLGFDARVTIFNKNQHNSLITKLPSKNVVRNLRNLE